MKGLTLEKEAWVQSGEGDCERLMQASHKKKECVCRRMRESEGNAEEETGWKVGGS